MTVSSKQLQPIGPWPLGIDNRHDEHELSRDKDGNIIALRQAENVDLSRGGVPKRRDGYNKVKTLTNSHSAFAMPAALLAVSNNSLVALDGVFNSTTLRSGLHAGWPLSYAEINGDVYWSNGFECGKVTESVSCVPWGIENPGGTPNVTQDAAGGLGAGAYQVAMTFATATFEEGGSTSAAVISIAEGAGIALTSIPQPIDSRIAWVRVYRSDTNGDKLYWVRDVPVGMTSCTLGVAQLGKEIQTQWLSPMPPGHIVRYGNGRMWVASENVVWYSEPLHYGQTRRSSNHITFSDNIDVMEYPNEGDGSGLFVAAGKRTYFLAGQNPKEAQLRIVHPYGAIKGTGATVNGVWFDPQLGGNIAYWMDSDGVPVLGLLNGTIRPLTGQTYLAPAADSGSTFAREIRGMRQIVTNLRGVGTNVARSSDALVGVIHRNGVSI